MDENQTTADMPASSTSVEAASADSGQAPVNESIQQAGETVQPAEMTDAYSGHGGSYVVDAGTQTRKPNK